MSAAPLQFEWEGDVFRPLARHRAPADKQFVVGMVYPLVVHEDRSTNSHNHFFAAVHEAWKNLPERIAPRFPTSEHLRKWALIKAGFADERSIACATPEEALKVASFIKPMDDFAVLAVADDTIKVFTAKSQSTRAMDKKAFQDSKQAVLDIVAEMIGVDSATLSANTNSAQVSPPEPDPKPAPETLSVPSAGTNSTSAPEGAATRLPDAEPKQAGGGGDDAVANVTGLPADWPTQYAAALGAAQTVGSLTRYAASFWKARGGYERVKADKPTYEKAEAVYAAYRDHFGPANEERRNALLQEIGAA